jgi:LPXTG-motif cell wall-anchored protein
MLAGAGVPATELHLGRVAGSADAVPASLTIEPEKPSVSVRVSNSSGKAGRVVGWLDGKAATAVAPARSATVTLTWEEPVIADADSGVLRLELYPEGENQPSDIEEHPVVGRAGGKGYNKPEQPKPEQPKPEQPKEQPKEVPAELPQTGSGTSTIAMVGVASVLFGAFVLGSAWVLRRRFIRDRIS